MHNFMQVEVHMHWMFFWDSISQEPFSLFFNSEIVTWHRRPHLITNSYNVSEEYEISGYTTPHLCIIIFLA